MPIFIFNIFFILQQSVFYSNPNQSEPNGIRFKSLSWENTLKAAKKENKLIFIDVYTTWCGPCNQLKKTTFVDTKLANYFNTQFINIACDAESVEGKIIASQFQVQEYPTMLFLSPEGKVIQIAIGYYPAKLLLALAKDVSKKH
jgi:thioredoxin 1